MFLILSAKIGEIFFLKTRKFLLFIEFKNKKIWSIVFTISRFLSYILLFDFGGVL